MEFDNVISNALKFENDLYNKKYSNSLFRVNRRDKSRLVLTDADAYSFSNLPEAGVDGPPG